MTIVTRSTIVSLLAICGLTTTQVSGTDSPPDHGHAPAAATATAPVKPAAMSPSGSSGTTGSHGATGYTGTTKTPIPAVPLTLQPASAKDKPATAKMSSTNSESEPEALTPDAVLKILSEGNQRWVKNVCTDPNTDPERRAACAANGQKPMVTILTCADSRLPVERMFDRGVGELFVIRVAGNVVGSELAGTVEYGLGHLHTPLLVVMGHTKCGAVAATVSNAEVHGHIKTIVDEIRPAAERAKRQNPSASEAELVNAAVRENVWQSIYDLMKASDEVRRLVSEGDMKVVGAVADISTGKVEFLGEHPWQSELLASLNAGKNDPSHVGTSDSEPKAEKTAEVQPAKDPHGH